MQNSRKRINFFIFIVFTLFSLILLRLFYLQILHGKEYKSEGEDQYFFTTGDNFNRGAINFTDKSGNPVTAVQMTNEYDIAIDPKTIHTNFDSKIKNIQDEPSYQNQIYGQLLDIFKKNSGIILNSTSSLIATSTNTSNSLIDLNSFISKINKPDSSFEVIATNVNEDIANSIVALKIKGMIVNRKKSRVYFEKDTGAKVFGFVGYSDTSRAGLYGLEKYYNDVLQKAGTNNSNFFAEVFSDLSGKATSNNNSLKDKINNTQGDINLTLDPSVERDLHQVLVDTKAKWNSEKIGGIIMDINDGSIVGMDELPSFDPNNYKDVDDISYYNNDLVSGVYEMGSIIKPLTMAAALDSNTVNSNTTYYDAGTLTINRLKVSNYDKKARGANTPIQQILSQSLNVGIAFLVEKMGEDTTSKYFHRYGLGDYTGIDLPSEASGLTANLDTHILVDSVTAGFGQGIAITPIQTIRALATLGNGGMLVSPHIVKSINYDDGSTKIIALDNPTQVFDNASTSPQVTNMLIKVVDDAMHMKNPKYTIAAKTGTAQMVNPTNGKYYNDRYLHSFMGYFPATKPRYIIFLYQTYPKGAQYASQTLKDSFFNLVDFLVNYYEIPPDR
jgi:cell division protein FtsI (penicillin-binding protein 3)/stage V sporulation protein D (sporulation-specific penicillin-binding protein)